MTVDRSYAPVQRELRLPDVEKRPSAIGEFITGVKRAISSQSSYPEDEYEEVEDTNEGSVDIPREAPFEDVMEVIQPRTKVEKKGEVSRTKVLCAATPDQITEVTNNYLNKIETDPKLSNVIVKDIKFSSSSAGYSVLIWMVQK